MYFLVVNRLPAKRWGKDGEYYVPPKSQKESWGKVKRFTSIKPDKNNKEAQSLAERMNKMDDLNERSARGDADAQYDLAEIYFAGSHGLDRNPQKASTQPQPQSYLITPWIFFGRRTSCTNWRRIRSTQAACASQATVGIGVSASPRKTRLRGSNCSRWLRGVSRLRLNSSSG